MKEEWEKVTIEEICEYVTSGGTPLASREDYYNPGTIPWLKTKEVNYCRITETENYISEKGLNNSSAKIIPKNSVIMAMYGQGDTAGRVAINKIPLTTNQACCNLIINKEKADYNFVYYKLSTLYDTIVALKSGGAQPNLNAGKVKGLEITLPQLPTQQKIAAVLGAYDDLIENNRKQIKLLEEAAQKLYKEWFVKLNFPGHETTKIVDGIPEGWKKGTLNDFGIIITGKTPSTKNENYYGGDIPFVKIPDMHKGIFTIKTEEYLTIEGANTQKNKFIPSESLIVSCIGTAGLVNIAYEECQTNQQINSIVCTKKENVYYLYYFLKSQKEYLNALGSNGATMVNVNKEKFGNVEVLIPNDKILERFAVITKPYFDKIKNCQLSIFNSQSARDKLLPKLMNGEIYV